MTGRELPNLRSGSSPFERTANNTQRRLLSTFEAWSVQTRRDLLAVAERGGPPSALSAVLGPRLGILEANLQQVLSAGVQAAINVSVGRDLARSPTAVSMRRAINAQNFNLISTNLIPLIREGLDTAFLRATVAIDEQFLANSFAVFRSRVTQFAGGAWVAIFEVQRRLGQEMEAESGERQPVRWNLNELAEHCSDSATHHGCPSLAGEYASWSELVTVPAGQVTCRGNCRCYLTVLKDGEWVRGL